MIQLLGGLSDRLLDSLKDVLVERHQLTLGKELGKGLFNGSTTKLIDVLDLHLAN